MKLYGQLEAAQLENLGSDPTPTPHGRLYFHTSDLIAKLYTSLGWGYLPVRRVSGSTSVPESVTTTVTILADGSDQTIFVKGVGGQTVSVALVAGKYVGQKLTLVGTSNTDYVIVPDTAVGTFQNGDAFLGAGNKIQYSWDGDFWSEDFRR